MWTCFAACNVLPMVKKWIVLSYSCEYKGLWNIDRRDMYMHDFKQLKMQWPVNTYSSCTLKLSFLQMSAVCIQNSMDE